MIIRSTILGVILTTLSLMVGSKTFGQERNIAEGTYVEEEVDTSEPLADTLRYILIHRGIVFRVGYDMRVSSGHHAYGALFESTWHISRKRLSIGVGAAVGVDAHISDTVSYNIGGSSGESYPTYHRIEENTLSIPIYATILWSVLPRAVSPEIGIRAGVEVTDNDTKPYMSATTGCRVALERVSVTPYVGCVWDRRPRLHESAGSGRFNFGLLVGF